MPDSVSGSGAWKRVKALCRVLGSTSSDARALRPPPGWRPRASAMCLKIVSAFFLFLGFLRSVGKLCIEFRFSISPWLCAKQPPPQPTTTSVWCACSLVGMPFHREFAVRLLNLSVSSVLCVCAARDGKQSTVQRGEQTVACGSRRGGSRSAGVAPWVCRGWRSSRPSWHCESGAHPRVACWRQSGAGAAKAAGTLPGSTVTLSTVHGSKLPRVSAGDGIRSTHALGEVDATKPRHGNAHRRSNGTSPLRPAQPWTCPLGASNAGRARFFPVYSYSVILSQRFE